MNRRPGTRSILLALLALVGVAAAALTMASSGDSGEAPDWLPRYGGEVSGDDGGYGGTLVLEGRCLYVTSSDGWRSLPIFPRDTTFSSETGTLTVLGKKFKVAGEFRSGGGETHREWLKDLLAYPDPSCDTTNLWGVGDVD